MADHPDLSDDQRFPLLDDAGRRMLRRLREHPHAPRWNHHAGERLTAAGLAAVRAFAERVRTSPPRWRFGELPPWVRELMDFCRRDVPFHRRRTDWSDDFFALPPLDRANLRREPWAFVPDSTDLTDLIVYTTSGTTGERLHVLSHAETPNRYLPLMEAALATHGVALRGGERVAIIQVSAQLRTIVQPSVVSFLGFAGYAKINLNPDDWRDPDDRVRFLDDCDAELYTGDPFSFVELMKLPLRTRPKALLSSATTLLAGLRRQLEAHFGCPVLDIYSLNEAGPVAFARGGAHEILSPDLYVEILDPQGRPCPPGVRGEITLTSCFNPFLSLLRYRTADFAALDFVGSVPRLVGFTGRPPTVFRNAAGRLFSSLDVSTVLRELPLPCFSLHQSADGSLCFRTRCDEQALAAAEQALRELFGSASPLSVEVVPDSVPWQGKMLQYSSDFR